MVDKFRDARAAVYFMYQAETRLVLSTSSFFRSPGGGGGLTTQDIVAQASMIRSLMVRELSHVQMNVLDATYTYGTDQSLLERKYGAMNVLAAALIYEMPRLPVFWVADTIRAWAGIKRHHDDVWWASHLEVSDRTIRRWRNGRDKVRGVMPLLDDWYNQAVGNLDQVFYEKGLLE